MEAVIKLDIDEITVEFIDNLKKLFPGRKVEIKVEDEMDATEFIMSRPAYAEELTRRIESVENGTARLIEVKPEELL
jgi:hypothetical protein